MSNGVNALAPQRDEVVLPFLDSVRIAHVTAFGCNGYGRTKREIAGFEDNKFVALKKYNGTTTKARSTRTIKYQFLVAGRVVYYL